jgi:hypothetical protein
MYGKKPMPGGNVYKGGSQNFNEASGQYSQKPAMNKPAAPKPPMTKPQARMQAMQKRFK